MMQRVRQFIRALRAEISAGDRKYVSEYLSEAERTLFYAMHEIDQYHALRVARTAERLAEDFPGAERRFLLRCALLHDVGRVKGDLDLWGKVFCVLMDACFPNFSGEYAKAQCEHFWDRPAHALYVYYHHAEIGAEKLRQIGVTREAALIERHHRMEMPGDSPELRLLREADKRN